VQVRERQRSGSLLPGKAPPVLEPPPQVDRFSDSGYEEHTPDQLIDHDVPVDVDYSEHVDPKRKRADQSDSPSDDFVAASSRQPRINPASKPMSIPIDPRRDPPATDRIVKKPIRKSNEVPATDRIVKKPTRKSNDQPTPEKIVKKPITQAAVPETVAETPPGRKQEAKPSASNVRKPFTRVRTQSVSRPKIGSNAHPGSAAHGAGNRNAKSAVNWDFPIRVVFVFEDERTRETAEKYSTENLVKLALNSQVRRGR
jgi:hypothetical protein